MTMTKAKVWGTGFLVLATLFWAGNYVLGAGAVRAIPPLALVFWRWVLAVVPLLVIAQVVERPDWTKVVRRLPMLVLLAAFGFAGYNLLLYTALLSTTALNASLINAFNPALIVVAAVLFLGQPVGWRGVVGLVLGLVGVLLVLTGGRLLDLLAVHYNGGDLVMLGAIVCWTAYTVLGRRLKDVGPITATAAQAVVVVVALAPFALAFGAPFPTESGPLASLLFIAFFPSVLSYVLWNLALARIDPAKAGMSLNLITVFTALASVALGQPLTWAQAAGGVLVIGGVVLASRR
jgi:drug/metabolite transporter (DMT)-like permease